MNQKQAKALGISVVDLEMKRLKKLKKRIKDFHQEQMDDLMNSFAGKESGGKKKNK
jgi:hypothetical protein